MSIYFSISGDGVRLVSHLCNNSSASSSSLSCDTATSCGMGCDRGSVDVSDCGWLHVVESSPRGMDCDFSGLSFFLGWLMYI